MQQLPYRAQRKSQKNMSTHDAALTDPFDSRIRGTILHNEKARPCRQSEKGKAPETQPEVIVISDDEEDEGPPSRLSNNSTFLPLPSTAALAQLPAISLDTFKEMPDAYLLEPSRNASQRLSSPRFVSGVGQMQDQSAQADVSPIQHPETSSTSVPSVTNNCVSRPAIPMSVKSLPALEDPTADAGDVSTRVPSGPPTKGRSNQARKRKRNRLPPYYEDARFGIQMYCGPGYEKFPVALQDLSHREKCHKWDQKENDRAHRKAKRQTLSQTSHLQSELHDLFAERESDESGESESEIYEEKNNDRLDRALLNQVLEMFPRIQHQYVLQMIRRKREYFMLDTDEVTLQPDVEMLVTDILELGEYPTEPQKPIEEKDPLELETGKKIVWVKQNKASRDYLREAVIILAWQFDHVPTHHIYKVVQHTQCAFDAFLAIEDADTNYFQRPIKPYNRPRHARNQLEKKYRRPHTAYRDENLYCDIVNEVQAAKQHLARQAILSNREKEKADFEIANLAQHKADGNIIECQCCFDDEIPINRAVACESTDMHWFCFECVRNLASSLVGMMKYEMLCMDGSGCKCRLSNEGVAQAVPIKIFDRLAFNQQQAEVAAAGLEGLEQCPHCDFKAVCDAIEINPTFQCQNPECLRVTCRRCHEQSHSPKSCEDFKKDKGLSAKHRIEEARSAAMIRTCPKCKAKIVKEMGCNKMRCTCGATMCYVCKMEISGYEHFNAKGAKCALHDTPNEDRHVQEANDAEIEAIREATLFDQTLKEETLQIETGKRKDAVPWGGSVAALELRNVLQGIGDPRGWHEHQNQQRGALIPPMRPETEEMHRRLDARRGWLQDLEGSPHRSVDRARHNLHPAQMAILQQVPPPQIPTTLPLANEPRGIGDAGHQSPLQRYEQLVVPELAHLRHADAFADPQLYNNGYNMMLGSLLPGDTSPQQHADYAHYNFDFGNDQNLFQPWPQR